MGYADAMFTLIAFLLLDEDPARAEALQHTAKAFWGVSLTTEQAIEHELTARFAMLVVNDKAIEDADLHGVAGHESRWTNAVTHEVDAKGNWIGDSCGVMTPFDTYFRRCMPWELTPAGGFLAGALHLKVWADLCRQAGVGEPNVRICALNRYAGGSMDRQVPGQMTWVTFTSFAAKLKAEIRKRSADSPKS